MAKLPKHTYNTHKRGLFTALAVLVVGLGAAATLSAVKQSTQYQQHASSFQDLNSANSITATNNADGTMGPADYFQNFSNTFLLPYLGSLDFQITDPPQGVHPTDAGDPNLGKSEANNPHYISVTPTPTRVLPTQSQGQTNENGISVTPGEGNNNGGPQAVTSLSLTISKVEVHLAHIGIPGERNQDVTDTPSLTPFPTITPRQKTNQDVDKWEVLNMHAPQTIDLVQLANAKSFASLGLTKLVNGRYTEVRLYISSASATLQDGTQVALTIPGRANIVRVVEPFVINSNKTTTLTMDFDAQNSVIKAGNIYLLKPVVAHLLEKEE